MKVVILAGGLGTRLAEETSLRPKPMVEIGDKPIIWHIMKTYSSYGYNDFIICLGYRGFVIKEYFMNQVLHQNDVTFNFANGKTELMNSASENWKVSLVDTGEQTMTGGRLKRIRDLLGTEAFCMTYGDGLVDLDLNKIYEFHQSHGRWGTVTGVHPPSRFGALSIETDGRVTEFVEKPLNTSYINGGFFVIDPRALEFVKDDDSSWEQDCLGQLAAQGELHAFRHEGFWHPMDTLRDKQYLEKLWSEGRAPWKKW